MNQAWEMMLGDPTRKLVLMCLADHANEDDRTCWPAINTIARKCEVTRVTVQRHIKALERDGHISRRARTGDSTLYFILPEHASEHERTAMNRGGYQNDTRIMGDTGGYHSSDTGGVSPMIPKPSLNHQEPEEKKARKRAVRLPADWIPPKDWIEFANLHGLSRQDAYREGEKLRDWSLSSAKGAKLDWEATWRNWIRRVVEEKGNRQPNGASKHPAQAAMDELRRRMDHVEHSSDIPAGRLNIESD